MTPAQRRYLRAVGARVAGLRKDRGWTQDELAEHVELTPKYISEIERGVVNPSVLVLRAVASALEVPLHKLMAEPEVVDTELSVLLEGASSETRWRAVELVRVLLARPPR